MQNIIRTADRKERNRILKPKKVEGFLDLDFADWSDLGRQQAFTMGLPFYRTLEEDPHLFQKEYPNGKIELVKAFWYQQKDGKWGSDETVIKVLMEAEGAD